jgi:hypothetical protein
MAVKETKKIKEDEENVKLKLKNLEDEKMAYEINMTNSLAIKTLRIE